MLDAGGGGGGCLPGARARPADLSPADGFLLERLGVRYHPRAPGAGLGAARWICRRGSGAPLEDYRRAGALLSSRSRCRTTETLTEPWQLQLYRRSLKKKATVKALLEHLPPRAGPLLPGAGLRHRAHLALPAPAGRHLDEHRLRAGPRAVGPAAGGRPGGPDRATPRCRSAATRSTWSRRSTSSSTSRTTRPSSPRWCGCSSPAATSSSWRPRARPGGRASRSSGCSASPPTRRGSATRGTAIRPRAARALMERHGLRWRGWTTTAGSSPSRSRTCSTSRYHRKSMKGKDTDGAGLPWRHRADVAPRR